MTSVTIPNSVTNFGDYAFSGCAGLADENGFVIVGNVLFEYYGNGGDVVVSDGVASIGSEAFSSCDGLESVTMPNSVKSIGYWAFGGCESLASVTMKGECPDVGEYAFEDVSSNCTVYVSRSSTGWNVEVPGEWNGLMIEYFDESAIPMVADDASAVAVTNAIEGAGFADEAVKEVIGGSAEEYGKFKE